MSESSRIFSAGAFPIAAAVGGAVVPAFVFTILNFGSDGTAGWGVPMATDTAISLGMLALLGSRLRPLQLVCLRLSPSWTTSSR